MAKIHEIDERLERGETVRVAACFMQKIMQEAERHLGGSRCWHMVVENGMLSITKDRSGEPPLGTY